jgi:cytochrome d ubiquinol oxidase subunit II
MLDFSAYIDLPLVWGFIIATAVFLYAALDGFDLGCGIIFPFAPSDKCRDSIMNSIAPFWDGNETWLVLGGGGLFASFPLAYSILMPAFYIPIMLMLLGLIFRGVAFEFRFKADESHKKIWDIAFHGGSILAAFMQGIILGNFVQGVEVDGRNFSGGALDWANGFSVIAGLGVIFAYALLGSTWIIMKTNGITQEWARKVASYVLVYVAISMGTISISMPFVEERITKLWFSLPNFFYLLPIPFLTLIGFIRLWFDLRSDRQARPFILTLVLFFLGYLGLIISLFPWIVPFKFTIWQAAASPTSLSILLIGTAIFLPIILCYTAYSYYIFRGKTSSDSLH